MEQSTAQIGVDGNVDCSASRTSSASGSQSTTVSNSVNNGGDKKRKLKERSSVWEHYEKFTDLEGMQKARCKYCANEYKYDTKTCGTGTLKSHLSRCKEYPFSEVNKGKNTQMELSLQKEDDSSKNSVTNWRFDVDAARTALAQMVIVDEVSFRFVESEGFRNLIRVIQPRFRLSLRVTVANDCYERFVQERVKLQAYFRINHGRISFTTDTWTSIQRINCMCLTAHYINNDWQLCKKIINFCPIASHKGDAIGKAVEKCLISSGIQKVMTITVDNASSNDVAVGYLKKRLNNILMKGELLHVRCAAHIMNLVVGDGLKLADGSISRVRNVVRYVRNSPARINTFKACCVDAGIESKSFIILDVTTRWNYTYMMLERASKFKKAFERFVDDDISFERDLYDSTQMGRPTEDDWIVVSDFVKVLGKFYKFTCRVSGTRYVTYNTFLHELCTIYDIVNKWSTSDVTDLRDMALRMKGKLDKYWGDPEKLNVYLFIGTLFDPRCKMEYLNFMIDSMHYADKAEAVKIRVKETLHAMFEVYGGQTDINRAISRVESTSHLNTIFEDDEGDDDGCETLRSRFRQFKAEEKCISKTELDRYFNEATEDHTVSFDILKWWKVNSPRLPILSQMARDVLAIPVSTVASESAFSTGGWVLDSFRSSLSPRMVEALICAQNWIRTSQDMKNFMETLEEIEHLDEDLCNVSNAPPVIDIA